MMGKRKAGRRLSLLCALPEDVLCGGARVTLFARDCVMIEGQQGVVELGGARIRLKTRGGVLTVLGEGLALSEMTADAAMISGTRLDTVTYGRGAEG